MASATLLLVLLWVGGSAAFLATPLNTSDPDVASVFCPGEGLEESRDHEWITREAIRRNIRQFFMDNPPDGADFFVPEEATLTELYHAYYGATSSPTRFIKAVNSIASANVKADSSPSTRYDPSIQGDGEELGALQATLVARYPQILTAIARDEAYPAARSLLGTSLHSLQKFYAHSTWVELGNTDILPGLGVPGSDVGTIASPTDVVCTPCFSEGTCTENVVPSSPLSSGYYTYVDNVGSDFLIPKPPTGGKCSHGGVLDDSSSRPAEGGINKDTTSSCFSPHHYLHAQAAELAVQATDDYLRRVNEAVKNDKYRRLFDLYMGSALSIVIDTTGSMSDDIEAVKNQVAEIVSSSVSELYILVPFNDPEVGPLVATSDPKEFLDAVNSLYASGGGDYPEMFWGGLQLALKATPPYGNIFCFTDADGKDGELMEGVISLAQQQHNKATVILSDILRTERHQSLQTLADDELETNSTRNLVTSLAEYQRLADSTGGLLISTDKFDVSDIVAIISEGVETSTVNIMNLVEISGSQTRDVRIDNSVIDFEVRISGYVKSAVLSDITGTAYDLMDKAALEATANVEVVSFTSSFKAIRWTAPRYGTWNLDMSSIDTYTVAVTATSTLDFLGDFTVLDPSPPHPHYRRVEGTPLLNTVYYLEVTLVGHYESEVTKVNSVEFLDKAGNLLRETPYDGPVKDQMYIRTEALPDHPFYIQLSGHVSSGNVFNRLMSVLISPVQTSVEIRATSKDLSARPGESASAEFIVSNFGLESYFTVTGIDDMEFLVSVNPSRIYLSTNASLPVVASFTVPMGTPHGLVSTVIVTAKSEKQTQSVNSAITHFIVLPEVTDLEPPRCHLNVEPDCTGYNFNGICSLSSWYAQASLQDDTSGLYELYADPEGDTWNVGGFELGTTNMVVVDYTATCCTTLVNIIGVDGQLNVGKCTIDMGMVGGLIYDLSVDSVGDSWVALHWRITPSDYEIHYFEIDINHDFTQQFTCHADYCVSNITYLEACSLQTFNVTPVFDYNGEDVIGMPEYIEAITMDKEPGTPYNGTEIDATDTTITISWHPAHALCSFQYEVCYFEVGTDPSSGLCERTSDTTYTMLGLEKCSAYISDVIAISPSGHKSEPLEFYSVTICEGLPMRSSLLQFLQLEPISKLR